MTPPLFADYQPHSDVARPSLAVQIRSAGVEDIAAIAALTAERSGAPLEMCLKSAQRQLAADAERGNLTVVAELGNGAGVVGFGRARFHQSPPGSSDSDDSPNGWYLLGVIVAPPVRRQGIATALTRYRMTWIADRTEEAYYFANSLNLASIDLHRRLGFVEVGRPFRFPGAGFSGGGVGVLFRATVATPRRIDVGYNQPAFFDAAPRHA